MKDKIKFTDIGRAVYKTVSAFDLPSDYTVEDVYKTDKMAREFVDSYFADEA